MITQELEHLIQCALADGELTDKERSVLMKKAKETGVDLDEFEMILEAKVYEMNKNLSQDTSKVKSNNKHGEVRKCPACGAMVSAFTTKCSECGFEFNNIESVESANQLFEKLQALEMEKARELAIHEDKKNQSLQELSSRHNSGGVMSKLLSDKTAQGDERDDLIRSFERGALQIERKYLDAKINMIKVFTVPNTKADLLELLSMASSNSYDNDGVVGPEEEAWIQKTDQIYQKLVICASGDTVTLNQATNMIVSLIKRLPSEYKNFTRMPKELRDKINVELKAQKEEQKEEYKNEVLNILKGWRGIVLGIALFAALIDIIFIKTYWVTIIAIVILIVIGKNTKKAIDEAKRDLLY